MERLLRLALTRFIRSGNLRLTTAGGETIQFGDGTGAPVAMRFTSKAALYRVLRDPELQFGEAYMDGGFVLDDGTIGDLLGILLRQDRSGRPPYFARPQWLWRFVRRRITQFNRRTRARHNAAHHYDLDGRLYSLFLDSDLQYSCGYFENVDQSLDDAQLAKKRHLAAKLLLKPEQSILDIGCGWGGLALYLAEFGKGRVTGITLSQEQLKLARERASEKALSDHVQFRMQDYRDVKGPFDRIVSVGMFEHVGVGYYDSFFKKSSELLANNGVMLLHSIGRSEGPNVTNPWIAKYIFPGGYIPALSEVLPAIERAGLLVTDIEVLRLHYAETLKNWRERFLAHAKDVERIYDGRFLRMWKFYLAASERAFREGSMMVFQIQITKRQDLVPMTRDYIAREEARLRAQEGRSRPPLRIAGE